MPLLLVVKNGSNTRFIISGSIQGGIMPLFDVRFFLNDVSFTPKRDVNQYDNDSLRAFSVITINRLLIARA
jgi:hypothetical protein